MQTSYYITTCRECGSSDAIDDYCTGDRICTGCGLVLEEHLIDERPEWSTPETARCEPARDGPSELGTYICPGRAVAERRPSTLMLHLHAAMHRETGPSVARVTEGARALGVPCAVLRAAKALLRDVAVARVSKGAIADGMSACCVYYACMQTGLPRHVREVCAAVGVDESTFVRADTLFKGALEKQPYFKTLVEVADEYTGMILRSIVCLGLPAADERRVRAHALKLAAAASRRDISGKSVRALSSGIIALACEDSGVPVSARDVARLTGLATAPTVHDAIAVLRRNGVSVQ